MSKIVISGYYGFNNAGDEALLTAILAALRAEEPTVDITVISGNPGNTIAKHQVKSLYRFAAVRLLRAIREADLVISGGGSLLQDVTSKRSLAYYLSVIAAAKWKRKKVMLFAQGIGPIRSRFMRLLTRLVVNRADVITVRDHDSAEELARMGVPAAKVEVTADPVLMLNPESKVMGKAILAEAGLNPYKPIIGVSVREWPDNQHCLKQLAAALGKLSEEYNAQIAILPLQVSKDLADSNAAARADLCGRDESAADGHILRSQGGQLPESHRGAGGRYGGNAGRRESGKSSGGALGTQTPAAGGTSCGHAEAGAKHSFQSLCAVA